MKDILILSFLYENNLCLKEFELLREHYNKMIKHFCFPMKYYGVRATEDGETRIDEENQIIWLHTDNLKEYDRNLTQKVFDCFKFIEESHIKYDIIVKTNTSFLINLQKLNNISQSWDTDDVVITGILYDVMLKQERYKCFRGNFVMFGKTVIQDIVVNFDIKKSYVYDKIDVLLDDYYFSYFIKDKYHIYCLGQLAVTQQHEISPYNPITNIKQILNVVGVCIKVYQDEIHSNKYANSTEHELKHFIPDITFMKLFIGYIEDTYIHEQIYNIITNFTFKNTK